MRRHSFRLALLPWFVGLAALALVGCDAVEQVQVDACPKTCEAKGLRYGGVIIRGSVSLEVLCLCLPKDVRP